MQSKIVNRNLAFSFKKKENFRLYNIHINEILFLKNVPHTASNFFKVYIGVLPFHSQEW